MDRATEYFNPDQHPRAASGTMNGGQFTSSTSAARTTKSAGHRGAPAPPRPHHPRAHHGHARHSTLPKLGRHASRRTQRVQQALNRLHITDAKGKKVAEDGHMGPLTRQAIKKLQARLGFKATGRVSAAFLKQIVGMKKLPAARAKASEDPPMDSRTAEAVIDGQRTFDEIRDLVRDALTARIKAASGVFYTYVYIADLTDAAVIYTCADDDDLMQCSYVVGTDESVTLGEPVEVVRTYAPAATARSAPPEDGPDDGEEAMESVRVAGRVVEALGTDDAGGRVYRVRIIAYGDSKNGRRYPEAVMREAVSLYEGAKAYDHHRTLEELQSSTLTGLVGHYRDVAAETDGVYGDLHLLPSATHAAEALDASLSTQDANLPPVVGISHDVQCHFRPIVDGGRRLQEAVQVVSVDSADIVAKPSAGGKAIRAVAGGNPTTEEESDVPTLADLAALAKEATDEALAAAGLSRVPSKTTESTTPPPTTLQRATEGPGAESAREAEQPKTSFLGKLMVQQKVADAGLPVAVTESLLAELPDRITESDVDARVASLKSALGILERPGLVPTVTATVTQEAHDKKVAALDAFFNQDFSKGYRSFKEAWADFTGYRPAAWGEDINKKIMRESISEYDSDGRVAGGERTTESLSASSWNLVLGDSITRRLVAEYHQPNLMTWRQIVSSVVPINDFRTQRIDRIGGYGTLPGVNQGAPYQPLTSPTNEEVTYAITKRGGTEDVTLEMIANDDVRAISRIPTKLGLAAANTLYQFVWNFLVTNPNIYDSTALFTGTGAHANFVNNAAGTALSQSALSAGRLLMRSQTAYGDAQQFIAPTPRTLVVVNDIEELAWQLVTSAVALPTPAGTPPDSTGAANTPNLHQGLNLVVLDYVLNATSTTAWWLAADPNMTPTIEVGFYQGREDPELFTQSDPTVGSVFNADKVTYKIRHIYSGAVLDYRGLVKGNN
jgi:peptidoglycan hydrolase-like protein with peptidoglycan-binding domain